MASTYSPLLRLELIAAGEQAGLWGNTTNSNLGTLIEQAIAGCTVVALTALSPATYTLSSTNGTPDEARAAVLLIQGSAPAATTVVVPSSQKTYIVRNSTSYTVTFKTVAQTGGVDVVTGGSYVIFCDGSNVYSALSKINVADGGTGVTTFTAGVVKSPGGTTPLTTGLVDLTAEVSGVLPVANGGNGLTTITGTGPVVRQDSPTFTGLPLAPNPTFGANNTQVATTSFVQAAVLTGSSSAVPVGAIFMWGTASPPSGYLVCSGGQVSRTTYASLFAVIGTAFGAGDGSTTFTLPSSYDRMPLGAGSAYIAGQTGGSRDAVLVSHTHTAASSVFDPGHQHVTPIPVKPNGAGGGPYAMVDGFQGIAGFQGQVSDARGTNISVSTSIVANGVSAVNANMPPYIGLYFIIKAT